MLVRKILYICSLCTLPYVGWGQSTQTQNTDKEYMKQAYWIEMIKDTATNYFEAQKAFNLYFTKHELPEEEHDVIGEREERERHPSKRKLRKLQAENRMRLEVKKYYHWRETNKPYVQADGSILGPWARIQIWKNAK